MATVKSHFEVYGFIDGQKRMIRASTREQADRVEAAMNAAGVHYRTVEKFATTPPKPSMRKTTMQDLVFALAIMVGILYGVGAL